MDLSDVALVDIEKGCYGSAERNPRISGSSLRNGRSRNDKNEASGCLGKLRDVRLYSYMAVEHRSALWWYKVSKTLPNHKKTKSGEQTCFIHWCRDI